ncbi:hypothetical protein N474_01060 [Pseudoalteromonas luteoviolacea CPMOR-2]|uniref:non-ribosomal peptide synthetase n=1 Tax=Pseudoalteromonas luteoviolacea TaxID=43657 RepID=UPI0007B043FC|nr:non-ribosomal peptide synthetase [Pseudoalteromonas luteoviolacea]KZN55553.1 hypothetical protein N474_01060 [Pseudoalteromonas luteoviolacea CPMOR-2]
MKALEVILLLHKNKILLSTSGDKLVVDAPRGAVTVELANLIRTNKQQLLAFLTEQQHFVNEVSTYESIKRMPRSEAIVLSDAQQRLWFVDNMADGDSVQYNIPVTLRVKGAFDPAVAERAVGEIIERHETLRTVFAEKETGPVQIILPEFDFKLARHDLSGSENLEEKVAEFIHADNQRAFDLSKDLMVRASWLNLSGEGSEQQGILQFNIHHIASDGWSMGVLVKEFVAHYQSIQNGTNNDLLPLNIQYADYAQWQQEQVEKAPMQASVEYWQKQLEGIAPVHNLPLDYERGPTKSQQGKVVTGHINKSLSEAILQLAKIQKITPFMLLHAALALLLSRHSNNTDVVIGTPVANRTQAELESLIGCFINTLTLRAEVTHDTLSDYFCHIKQVNLDAQAHQGVAFERLVDLLNVPRSMAYTPLFQILFTLDTNETKVLDVPGLSFTVMDNPTQVVKFDIDITAAVTREGIKISWVYDETLFKQQTIERLNAHLFGLLERMVNMPNACLAELSVLSDDERHYLLVERNQTALDYADESLIHQVFEAQVESQSERLALVFDDHLHTVKLSYTTLNEQANQLAHYLKKLGVGEQSLVGICLQRSHNFMVSVLAVLKAGGAYLPLDPNYPVERLQYMLEDSGLQHLVTLSTFNENLTINDNIKVIALDVESCVQQISACPSTNVELDYAQKVDDLAYVIYTSGSTGKPKGVMLCHQGVVNLAHAQQASFPLDPQSRVLQFASSSFDACVWEWIMALLGGSTLVICNEDQKQSPEAVAQFIIDKGVTHALLPPALLRNINSELQYPLKCLIVAGEACSESLALQWAAKTRFYNAYGPTEATVCATIGEVTVNGKLTIGEAIANSQMYVLDTHQNLMPKGGCGELYIGGAGVAKGYLNHETLTANKFVDNPFADLTGNKYPKLYRTGDLVRYLPCGRLEFIGRIDDQVKLRGYRIEPGEVAHAINEVSGVAASLVMVREDTTGESALVAYVEFATESEQPKQLKQLKTALRSSLPQHMIPTVFVMMSQWPLTPNGKIDKKALPELDDTALLGEYVAPRSYNEQVLVRIWAKLLGLAEGSIGIHADFFALGGHSLRVTQMLMQIRELLDVKVPVVAVFENPTIDRLAQYIATHGEKTKFEAIPELAKQSDYQVSEAQKSLYMLVQSDKDLKTTYNISTFIQLDGALDIPRFNKALNEVVKRHDVLRSQFISIDGQIRQQVLDDLTIEIDVIEIHEGEAEVLAQKEDFLQPFDLSKAPLVRGRLLKFSVDKYVFMFDVHHIIFDGTSSSLFIKEVISAYEGIELAPVNLQYHDFAKWQESEFNSERFESAKQYWMQQFAKEVPKLELPSDRVRAQKRHYAGSSYDFHLSRSLTDKIEAFNQTHGSTLFMFLLASLNVLLFKKARQSEFVVGTPVAGRSHPDVENIIGMFINTIALRNTVIPKQTFEQFLSQVKSNTLAAYQHQNYPFNRLVNELNAAREPGRSPLFDIMLVLQNTEQASEKFSSLKSKPYKFNYTTSKFDMLINTMLIDGELNVTIEYSTQLFDQSSIATFAKDFGQLIDNIIKDPQQLLADVEIVSAQEKQGVLDSLAKNNELLEVEFDW